MKQRLGLVLLVALLTGCAGLPAVTPGNQAAAPKHYGSADILREADRLASQVKDGELNRVEAADRLNRYRLAHVGHNAVDDNTFTLYRSLAVAREQNRLSQDESMARMHSRLIEWQNRWPEMARRPANPAFTNFLMTVYGLPPLTR